MKYNQPVFEIWQQADGLDGIYRQVERAGRVCYKSEDHQTDTSAQPFVERMIKSRHTAMLEHATVYLSFCPDATGKLSGGEDAAVMRGKYLADHFTKVVDVDGNTYVTTNFRVIVEREWTADLRYLTPPTAHHEQRVTVHFTTQIGTTREFNRHRVNSMAEQSTRYCNYAKNKFGNETTVNLPVWVIDLLPAAGDAPTSFSSDLLPALLPKVMDGTASDLENWLFGNLAAEKAYLNLTASGRKPQEARAVLPLDTNTELVHTAFVSDWRHFFNLRALGTTGAPHPDAQVLAQPLMEAFKTMGYM